ncbi:MAG: restriction endonuclease subunit S [Alphaproteobacteria bacterium]
MTKWQEVKLEDVCFYVSQKMDTQPLSIYNYISTENMLPNKSGITNASSLPNIPITPSFKKDDILVSNIRPYFKKIWLAQFAGGCSNDVLVFRANKNIDSKFLYYILSDDRFFEYSTQTSKGTKMPRGDKTSILKYAVLLPPLDVQKKIAGVLGALDDKIELNNKINQNLEAQAQALFKSWFVDFEPFGSKMPSDWKIGKVEDIVDLYDSQRIPLSNNQRAGMKKVYPYYGATSVMDFVDNYIFDGKYLLLGEDGTVIDDKGFPILQYVWGKFWVNNHAHIMTGKNGFNVESLYLFFNQTNVKGIVTGAVQPKINQANLKMLPVNIPSNAVMNNFNKIIEPLFSLFRINTEENLRLVELRETLLPKLMSGEINVDNVKID